MKYVKYILPSYDVNFDEKRCFDRQKCSTVSVKLTWSEVFLDSNVLNVLKKLPICPPTAVMCNYYLTPV